jgi:hexokinase
MQVQSICRLVLRRSARLATSLLVAVLRLQEWFMAPRHLVVAVDGGVFLKCAHWRKYLTQYLAEAFGELWARGWRCQLGGRGGRVLCWLRGHLQ